MGLGGILIVIGLLLWEGFESYYSGKPAPGMRWWQNPLGDWRMGGFLVMVSGAICVVAGIVLILVNLLS